LASGDDEGGQTLEVGALGSWPEGEGCLRWIESRGGSAGAWREVDPFEVDVLAELRLRGGRHWVVRQIQKRRDAGTAISAADEEELRPLRAERTRWTTERSRRGIPYGLPEFDSDPLGGYVRVYGSVPDQPIETWDESFLAEYERIERDVFEVEWRRARDALESRELQA
jgi:hypothetical protein